MKKIALSIFILFLIFHFYPELAEGLISPAMAQTSSGMAISIPLKDKDVKDGSILSQLRKDMEQTTKTMTQIFMAF